MDGAATEAVRGLKAEQDSDLATIWEALARRFGFVDEPERAMRRFDVRKQLEGETLAVFEQSLRMLHREAWPKTDIKSPEADSLLRSSSWMESSTFNSRGIYVSMPPRTTSLRQCPRQDSSSTPAS